METVIAERARVRRHVGASSARLSVLLALVLALTLLGVPSALAISRDTVLARAQSWVDAPVVYSQARYHLGYRTDCSGYVSMCWATGTSWSTASFHVVSHTIRVADLKPGDAVLKPSYHIRLFYGWLDASHDLYIAYEAGALVGSTSIRSIKEDMARKFYPTRFNRIVDSPTPRNVLRNSSFDVWTSSWRWNRVGIQPVWWDVGGPQGTLLARSRDASHTVLNTVQLTNPSVDPGTMSEMSQAASVTAGSAYTVAAWAKAAIPAGLELRLAFLDAAGRTVAQTGTTGSAWHVASTAYTQMSATSVAPSGTVSARVSVRLAGGTTSLTSTQTVAGTAVVLNGISLLRPQVAIGIRASTPTARVGGTIALSGAVTPTCAIGRTMRCWVMKPGSGWVRLPDTHVVASGKAAAWRSSFRFARGTRKGVYRFKASMSSFPGYLAGTSNSVRVTLR